MWAQTSSLRQLTLGMIALEAFGIQPLFRPYLALTQRQSDAPKIQTVHLPCRAYVPPGVPDGGDLRRRRFRRPGGTWLYDLPSFRSQARQQILRDLVVVPKVAPRRTIAVHDRASLARVDALG